LARGLRGPASISPGAGTQGIRGERLRRRALGLVEPGSCAPGLPSTGVCIRLASHAECRAKERRASAFALPVGIASDTC